MLSLLSHDQLDWHKTFLTKAKILDFLSFFSFLDCRELKSVKIQFHSNDWAQVFLRDDGNMGGLEITLLDLFERQNVTETLHRHIQ